MPVESIIDRIISRFKLEKFLRNHYFSIDHLRIGSVRTKFAIKNALNYRSVSRKRKEIIPRDYVFGFRNFADGINFDVSFYRHEDTERQYTAWKNKHGGNDPFLNKVTGILDDQDYFLTTNNFPYYLEAGLTHFLLWTHKTDYEEILEHLCGQFENFRVFSNNIRTADINHYHVFVEFSVKNKPVLEQHGIVVPDIDDKDLIDSDKAEHRQRLIDYHRNRSSLLAFFGTVIPYLEGLTWWVNGGTLLGAVRHENIILLDDDIDISILKKDFEVLRRRLADAGFSVFEKVKKPYNKEFYGVSEPGKNWPFIDVMTFKRVGNTYQAGCVDAKKRRPFTISKHDLEPTVNQRLGNLTVKAPHSPYPLLNELYGENWPYIAQTHVWNHVSEQPSDFAHKKVYVCDYDDLESRTITHSVHERWKELPIPDDELISGGIYLYPKQLEYIVDITRKMNCRIFVECGFGSGHLATAVLEANPLCHVMSFDFFETDHKKDCADFISQTFEGRFHPIAGHVQNTLISTLNRMDTTVDVAYLSIPHYEMHNLYHLKDHARMIISTPLDESDTFFTNFENYPYVKQILKVTEDSSTLARDTIFAPGGTSIRHTWVVGTPVIG